MTEPSPKDNDNYNTCPKCGSVAVYGLVEAFWTFIDQRGRMTKTWEQLQHDTYIGPRRRCHKCRHEWGNDR